MTRGPSTLGADRRADAGAAAARVPRRRRRLRPGADPLRRRLRRRSEGEIVALLGTNGAGKSTLLKGICGLVRAQGAARCTFDGRGHHRASPADVTTHRGVALMPGGKGVFPTLTVAENLRLAAWLIRKDHDARRRRPQAEVEDAVPDPRASASSQMAGNLSGGEQQMLALGGALMARPAAADDRRAVARPGADDRRPAPRGRARDPPARAPRSSSSSSRSTSPSPSPSGPCSWRRARSASTGPPPSCSSGPTSCARCSSPAPPLGDVEPADAEADARPSQGGRPTRRAARDRPRTPPVAARVPRAS